KTRHCLQYQILALFRWDMMKHVGQHDDVIGLTQRSRIRSEGPLAAQGFVNAFDTLLRKIKAVHASLGQAILKMLRQEPDTAAIVEQFCTLMQDDVLSDVLSLVRGKVIRRFSSDANAVAYQVLVVGGEGVEFCQRLLR